MYNSICNNKYWASLINNDNVNNDHKLTMIVTMTRNKSMRMKIKSTDIIKIGVKNEKQCKREVDL